jgi:protein-tyrosine kinase
VESIKEALKKAKAAAPTTGVASTEAGDHIDRPRPEAARPSPAGGVSIPFGEPDARHLERGRIVAFSRDDPTHIAFNLLRTKVYMALKANRWRTLAVTSPTAGCGKTMVSLNLAISLARQPNCRTMLIDLDIRKSDVARTMGLAAAKSISQYLGGHATLAECCLRVGDNLILGLNTDRLKHPAELMSASRINQMLRDATTAFAPEVIVFDLPPMLATDETIAVLSHVDSAVLVIAAGTTTAAQVDECDNLLRSHPGFLGAVLNKAHDLPEGYYYGAT